MSLENFSLAALEKSKLGDMVRAEIVKIMQSFEDDNDIKGARTLSINLTFKPGNADSLNVDMDCHAKVPKRSVKTIGFMAGGNMQIDMLSGDARQTSLLDNDKPKAAGGGSITSIGQKK